MILALTVHHSRASDLVHADHMQTSPSVPIRSYRDGFGNWCTRLVAPAGELRISADTIVNDSGAADVVSPFAEQVPAEALPEETLVFLLGSRYCETDLLSETAWRLFSGSPSGWQRVQAHL
jgi:transglutaminase-like putative cysteine protease